MLCYDFESWRKQSAFNFVIAYGLRYGHTIIVEGCSLLMWLISPKIYATFYVLANDLITISVLIWWYWEAISN